MESAACGEAEQDTPTEKKEIASLPLFFESSSLS